MYNGIVHNKISLSRPKPISHYINEGRYWGEKCICIWSIQQEAMDLEVLLLLWLHTALLLSMVCSWQDCSVPQYTKPLHKGSNFITISMNTATMLAHRWYSKDSHAMVHSSFKIRNNFWSLIGGQLPAYVAYPQGACFDIPKVGHGVQQEPLTQGFTTIFVQNLCVLVSFLSAEDQSSKRRCLCMP